LVLKNGGVSQGKTIFFSFVRKNELSLQFNPLQQRMKEKNNLLQGIIEGIQEKKGKKITTIRLQGIPGAICDYFVICEGNTPTQVSALAESVEEVVKKTTAEKPIRVQGQQRSEWVGIDYGNIIVHIFLPEMRTFYNIDHLWEDAKTENIPDLD
jgi:ribosome-associated protein